LRAHELDPAFARATVLALMTYQYGQTSFSIDEVVEETLKLAPDEGIIVQAAASTQGLHGGDFSIAYSVCAKYAQFIPDYTADQCAIEVALSAAIAWDVKEAALAALPDFPSSRLDAFRVDAAIRQGGPFDDLPSLIAIHNAQIPQVSDLADWQSRAQKLAYAGSNTFYVEEARALALAEVRKRWRDDPRNPWLALILIDYVQYDPNLPPSPTPSDPRNTDRVVAMYEQTHPLWTAALPYGYQSGRFWLKGLTEDVNLYADKAAGALAAIPYVENALVLSLHDPSVIHAAFSTYVWVGYDGWQYDNETDTSFFVTVGRPEPQPEVRCTLGRLARMMEYVCQNSHGSMPFCTNEQPGDEVKDILLKLQEPTYCPSVAAMSPSELAYTELRAVPSAAP
jgi:hypothetical protein